MRRAASVSRVSGRVTETDEPPEPAQRRERRRRPVRADDGDDRPVRAGERRVARLVQPPVRALEQHLARDGAAGRGLCDLVPIALEPVDRLADGDAALRVHERGPVRPDDEQARSGRARDGVEPRADVAVGAGGLLAGLEPGDALGRERLRGGLRGDDEPRG